VADIRVVKHVLTDPHRSVLFVQTKLEVLDETLRGRLRLYACWRRTSAVLVPATPGRVLKSAITTAPRAARERAPAHGMQQQFLSAIGRLRRFQRRLAGPDAQFKMDWNFRPLRTATSR